MVFDCSFAPMGNSLKLERYHIHYTSYRVICIEHWLLKKFIHRLTNFFLMLNVQNIFVYVIRAVVRRICLCINKKNQRPNQLLHSPLTVYRLLRWVKSFLIFRLNLYVYYFKLFCHFDGKKPVLIVSTCKYIPFLTV